MHASNLEAIWKQGYTTCIPSDPMYRGVPITRYGSNWSYLVSNMPVHDLEHCRQKFDEKLKISPPPTDTLRSGQDIDFQTEP